MAVLIGGITPRTDINTTTSMMDISGAWGVHALSIGTSTYVYLGAEDSNSVTSFELGADGSLSFVETLYDDIDAPLIDDASNVVSAVIGGTTFVYVNSTIDDDAVTTFEVGSNGTLSLVGDVADSDDPTLYLDNGNELVGKMSLAAVDGTTFLIAPGYEDGGVSVFRIEANGSLSNTANGGGVAGAWDTAAATVGGNTFIFAASSLDDFIAVGTLNGDGEIGLAGTVDDDATLELDGVRALATAVVGGTTFLVAGGYDDDGLSVFSVASTGALTNVSNIADSATRGLDGPTSITAFTLDTETFVVVSGENDNALGIFHLGADGTLTDVTTLFDGTGLSLESTNGNTVATVGGVPILIGTSNIESGITTFDIGSGDDTLVGTASGDILLGLAGDDVLDGGAGDDLMRGGSGDDTYAVDSAGDTVGEEAGAGRDTVRAALDFVLGPDLEDLVLLGAADLAGTGNGLGNRITGSDGGNLLDGRGGDDDLLGLRGLDDLRGGRGGDDLAGGGQDDLLTGGKGWDAMEGGGGADDFLFGKLADSGVTRATRDRILDFRGHDALVFTGIDAIRGQPGNQDFALDGNGDFTAGEIRVREVGAGVIVELNVDGDAQAELSVLLKGFAGTLRASDFEL